jgi:hypothetical protein
LKPFKISYGPQTVPNNLTVLSSDDSVQHPMIDIDGDGQGNHELKLEQNVQTTPETPDPLFNYRTGQIQPELLRGGQRDGQHVTSSPLRRVQSQQWCSKPIELQAPEKSATTARIFDWQTSIDPENEPITYTLLIAKDADFHNVVYQQSDIPDSELPIEPSTLLTDGTEGLQPETTYYWTAVDYFGAITTASKWRVFRTESE